MKNLDKLYETHKPEERRTHPAGMGGEQFLYKFPNGYGASVVWFPCSYGANDGLLELAVFGQDGHIAYDTPITNDVEGHLSADEAGALLDRIAALEKPDEN